MMAAIMEGQEKAATLLAEKGGRLQDRDKEVVSEALKARGDPPTFNLQCHSNNSYPSAPPSPRQGPLRDQGSAGCAPARRSQAKPTYVAGRVAATGTTIIGDLK
ncbi:hypothetical protein FRB95_001602 [Tulasnella sp. JGI-2019a]|nr:hypothetical protein FRB95_001602 [Tulasnella sp. JGI-2019a]